MPTMHARRRLWGPPVVLFSSGAAIALGGSLGVAASAGADAEQAPVIGTDAFELVDLGATPEHPWSEAIALNDRGTVALCLTSPPGGNRGFLAFTGRGNGQAIRTIRSSLAVRGRDTRDGITSYGRLTNEGVFVGSLDIDRRTFAFAAPVAAASVTRSHLLGAAVMQAPFVVYDANETGTVVGCGQASSGTWTATGAARRKRSGGSAGERRTWAPPGWVTGRAGTAA
jgi:hypothetical protein